MVMEDIVESPSAGGAASSPTLHAGFDWASLRSEGIGVNSGGVLIRDVTGLRNFGSDAVSGELFTFDYEVGDVAPGTTWTIGPGIGVNNAGGILPDSVTLTVPGPTATEDPAFVVAGKSSIEVVSGQTITIDVITSPEGAMSMTLLEIVDTASITGQVSEPWLSTGWTWDVFDSIGTIVNSDGLLIENVTGTVGFGDAAVEGIAYSFDYTVPDIPVGERWDIGVGGFEGGPSYSLALTLVGGYAACLADLNEDQQVDLDDLQALAGILLDAGSPFIVPVNEGARGDLNSDVQIDLDDLQAAANMLLEAGSPFIVQCE